MRARSPITRYFRNLWSGFFTTLVGMRITIQYFFTKTVTFQYPEQRMPIAPRYRGIHYLEQDLCIACRVCERACPIDCIEIRFERHPGSVNEWFEFTLDYNKCMFCELCCHPCPTTCIHMGKEYALVKYDRGELVHDLLTWDSLRDVDRTRIHEAEEEKKRKAEEVAARKAAAEKAKAEKEAADKAEAERKAAAERAAAEKAAAEKAAAEQAAAEKAAADKAEAERKAAAEQAAAAKKAEEEPAAKPAKKATRKAAPKKTAKKTAKKAAKKSTKKKGGSSRKPKRGGSGEE